MIAFNRLRAFWAAHADAQTSIRVWYQATQDAVWANVADMRATFGSASVIR